MKRLSTVVLVILLVLTPILSSIVIAEECSIELKLRSKLISVCGKKYKMDVAPVEKNESVYVPLRFVSEWLGYSVSWYSDERMVNLENDTTLIKLWIDKKEMQINGETKQLTLSPIIENSRTMVSTNGMNLLIGKEMIVDGRVASMKVDTDDICYHWSDFELPKDGNPDEKIKLLDIIDNPKTKAVIVQIWYTECRPCHDQLEFLGELDRKYKDDGLEIIGICTDGPGLELDRVDLLEELKVEFPIVLDKDYAMQAFWFDPVFPNFFLLTPGEPCVTWFHERYSEEANAKLEDMVKGLCSLTD